MFMRVNISEKKWEEARLVKERSQPVVQTPKSSSNSEGSLGARFSSETLVGRNPESLEEKMKASRGKGMTSQLRRP